MYNALMGILYCDEKILELERAGDYRGVIKYLETLLKKSRTAAPMSSVLAYSWYYAAEVNKDGVGYDSNFFIHTWRKYVGLGLQKHFNAPEFCFFAGYTLSLHGFYIMKSFAAMGKDLLTKCGETNDLYFRIMSIYIRNKCRHNKQTEEYDLKTISETLFPSESLVDCYFREIFS